MERRALGTDGDHEAALAVRAGEHLAAAGLRAAWRYDVTAAVNLLSRAHTLLPPTSPQRRSVMRRLAEAYQVMGRLAEADRVLQTMLAEAETDGDRSLAQVARLERARLRLFAGPDPTGHGSTHEAEQALKLFGESGDEAGLALAHYVLAYACFHAGRIDEMARAARRALVHADRSARRREAMASRMLVAWSLIAGPTPVPEAIHVCEQLVGVAGRQHPLVLSDLAVLRAMLGEFEDARGLVERARTLASERMPGPAPLLVLARARASVELAAGEFEAAERELRVALRHARDIGLSDTAAQTAAQLSLLAIQHDPAEATRLAFLSRAGASGASVAAQALWRVATAWALAGQGRHREAERLAREAAGLVPAEMLNLQGDILVDLAEVLGAGEEQAAASRVREGAIELYERKGNVVAAARVRSSLPADGLRPVTTASDRAPTGD